MIRLDAVEKRYGAKVALARLELHVAPRSIVALVGANGAGKSTALAIAAGQVIPDDGRVILGGHDLAREPLRAREALGYLPQDSPLPRALTVEEMLEFFTDVRRAPPDRAAELLRLAGLEAERETLVGELSGGMRRKLALAAALVGSPVALVLDEPFAGLDEVAMARFEGELRSRSAAGSGILFASHDLERTVALADEVVGLVSGVVALRSAARDVDASRLRALLESPPS